MTISVKNLVIKNLLLFGTKEVKKSREDSKLGPVKQLGILSENYVVMLLTATCYEK